MPTYCYFCPQCGIEEEVQHSMDFIGREYDLPQEIVDKITCNKSLCNSPENPMRMQMFKRKIYEPQLKGMYGGSTYFGPEKTKQVQKERKKRSKDNFKKEVYPTLPKSEKKHFQKKWKNEGK